MEVCQMFTQVKFNNSTLEVPANTSVEDAKAALERVFPEVKNADYSIEDGVLEFKVQANEKG